MIRFLLRFIGLICLAAGFILLIYDGTKSIAGNRLLSDQRADAVGADQRQQPRKTRADHSILCRRLPVGPA